MAKAETIGNGEASTMCLGHEVEVHAKKNKAKFNYIEDE